MVQKKNLRKFVDSGLLEQKMKEKKKRIVVILNEKEAGIIFPSNTKDNGEMANQTITRCSTAHIQCFMIGALITLIICGIIPQSYRK